MMPLIGEKNRKSKRQRERERERFAGESNKEECISGCLLKWDMDGRNSGKYIQGDSLAR
jgi:hypothetical protein